MESDSPAAGQGDEHEIAPLLLEALVGLDLEASGVISQVIVLYREFWAWALWLPGRRQADRVWAAVGQFRERGGRISRYGRPSFR